MASVAATQADARRPSSWLVILLWVLSLKPWRRAWNMKSLCSKNGSVESPYELSWRRNHGWSTTSPRKPKKIVEWRLWSLLTMVDTNHPRRKWHQDAAKPSGIGSKQAPEAPSTLCHCPLSWWTWTTTCCRSETRWPKPPHPTASNSSTEPSFPLEMSALRCPCWAAALPIKHLRSEVQLWRRVPTRKPKLCPKFRRIPGPCPHTRVDHRWFFLNMQLQPIKNTNMSSW